MNIFSKNQGEFVTDLVVVLDKNEFEAEEEKLTVEDALKQTVTGGRVGSLVVDPESLTMGEISYLNHQNTFFSDRHLYTLPYFSMSLKEKSNIILFHFPKNSKGDSYWARREGGLYSLTPYCATLFS